MSSPLQVVVLANAAAITLYCLNFTLPGSSTSHRNWFKVKNVLDRVAEQSVSLIPALSALVLPDVASTSYLAVGTGLWLVGVGFAAIPPAACETATAPDNTCSKTQYATQQLGNGLQTLGVSCGVGALLAYIRDMKLE